jgi:hypothetical protein
MKKNIVAVFLVLVLSMQCLYGQRVINGCGGGDPPPPPPPPPPATCPTGINPGVTNTPWGFYFWQVDLNPQTTTLTSEMDFVSNPGGLVQIPIPATGSLPCAATVHEIHGNVTLEVQQGGSCSFNSIGAQVLDQNGNAIASVSLMQFGPSSTNIPIKGTFSTPLSVTQFVLQFNLNPGCVSVLNWSLAMS